MHMALGGSKHTCCDRVKNTTSFVSRPVIMLQRLQVLLGDSVIVGFVRVSIRKDDAPQSAAGLVK